ncbi:MAG: hypothetical protein WCK26_03260 [Candidatus Saccharibacteria bacterium]
MTIFKFLAQVPKIPIDKPPITADAVLLNVLNITYFVAGSLAVIIIILAGYSFTTAVYDPAKITQAKNAILYSVVGLIVIIVAFVITQFIMGKF